MHGSYTRLAMQAAREQEDKVRSEGYRRGALAKYRGAPPDATPVNAWLAEYAYREGYRRGYAGLDIFGNPWDAAATGGPAPCETGRIGQ